MVRFKDPDNAPPLEHVSFIQEDYKLFPIRKQDIERESFFSGIGLKEVTTQQSTNRISHINSLPHSNRKSILSPGLLPFTSRCVYPIAKYTDQIIPDLSSYVMKSDRSLSRRILWPDAKFRKRVAEIGLIPSPDAEFQNLNWVTKRKRVAELGKKRRLKHDFVESEAEDKRKKLLMQLNSYPTRELLTMLPQITQDYAVVIERAEPIICPSCYKQVYSVEGRVYHNCSNLIELS
jgi:hypothetical protein